MAAKRREIGKLRRDLAKLLSRSLLVHIEPEEIIPVTGFWKQAGVYRWEVYLPEGKIGCWETMSSFYREAKLNGFQVDNNKREIWANETPQS